MFYGDLQGILEFYDDLQASYGVSLVVFASPDFHGWLRVLQMQVSPVSNEIQICGAEWSGAAQNRPPRNRSPRSGAERRQTSCARSMLPDHP